MIREELLHPAVSHFPIAFLFLSLGLKIAIVVFKQNQLQTSYRLLLYLGTAFILPTLFLGDMALDIVKTKACRLDLIHEHEELGEQTLYFFIGAILMEMAIMATPMARYIKKFFLDCFILLILGCGCFFLFETAEHGAELVYDQGVAVKREMGDCPK